MISVAMLICASGATAGEIATVAGQADAPRPADEAYLKGPSGVAVDTAGNAYIADTENGRVRRVDFATGDISTFAGLGGTLCAGACDENFSGDQGPATEAMLYLPRAVVADAAGNVYIADEGNHRVRRVDAAGTISTFAGSRQRGFGGDGEPANEALLNYPSDVAVDASGNVYIADPWNHRVRRVDAGGVISTFAGSGEPGFSAGGFGGDGGPADKAHLKLPSSVAVDAIGNVYIADEGNHRVRRVDAAGTISTFAGTGERGFGGDGGTANEALLSHPSGLAVDATGNVYVSDPGNDRVRRVNAAGTISTFAGTGERGFGGDGGRATEALLNQPRGVAVDATGNVYVADTGNDRVRRVNSASGVIATFSGRGGLGDGGPADKARLDLPGSIAIDHASGDVYIADDGNHRIRRIDAGTGNISTFAGAGFGFGGDGGPADKALFRYPAGVAVDAAGNVYVADRRNLRVRRVDGATSAISTFAGTGEEGFGGDGGPASKARFRNPTDVAVDAPGNVYVADRGNHRVRRVDGTTGVITTYAGVGERGFGGDGGPATEALLGHPSGVAVDAFGNLYIVDYWTARIRRVDAATGLISTIAGTGQRGFGGDGGPANETRLSPWDVEVDAAGNVYIVESGSHRVRRIDGATGVISTFAGTGQRGFGGDGGPADKALLNSPARVAVDATGNVFMADTLNRLVRRVSTAGPGHGGKP